MKLSKWVGAVGASALLAGSLAVVVAPAAQATGVVYGTMTVSPAGPYAGGEIVTITYSELDSTVSGTDPGNGGGYFIGHCVGDGLPQNGTPDCAPGQAFSPFPSPAGPASTVITGSWYYFGAPNVIPAGSVRFQIPAKGANAGYSSLPNYVCDNTTHCNIVVGDFSGDGPAQVQIDYISVPTTTTLTASPAGSSLAGTSVTLTAAVSGGSPTGTVQFRNGASNLGAPVALSSGQAQWTGTLPYGNLTLAADFVPTLGSAEDASSGSIAYTSIRPAATATTTALSVTPATAEALSAVDLLATVTPSTATGSCQFVDNGTDTLATVAVVGGECALTYSSFAQGSHSIVANFVPADALDYEASSSPAVVHTATAPAAAPAVGDLEVTVPAGTLTITTPYGTGTPYTILPPVMSPDGTSLNNFPNNPAACTPTFDCSAIFFPAAADAPIRVTDLRSGQLGWTAYARLAGDFDGPGSATIPASGLSLAFTGIPGAGPSYLAGNGLQAGDVTVTGINAFSDLPQPFASAQAGDSNGTVEIRGAMGLIAPTSTPAGLYTNVLTLTVA